MGLKKALKRRIIYSAFKKKKASKPFDIDESELFRLPKDADPVKNNSFFFGGYSIDNKSALVLRLGTRNLDYDELFVFYKNEEFFLVTPKDYYQKGKSPVKITCLKPGIEWEVSFKGELFDKYKKRMHKVSFSYKFINRLPIYDFFYSVNNPYLINATADCKWTNEFRESHSKDDQRHYEQAGFIKGEITIDNKKYKLDMAAGRDHSFGRRDWDEMNDHIWLFAFKENGEIFNFSCVNYPILKNINCGYCDISMEFGSLKKMKKNDYQANKGLGPDVLSLEMLLDNGKTVNVLATREVNHETHYQNGDYIFQEALGEFLINGEKAYGSIEYGFNKNPNRWEINK